MIFFYFEILNIDTFHTLVFLSPLPQYKSVLLYKRQFSILDKAIFLTISEILHFGTYLS